ncbi:hypothetical protein BGX23_009604 [Mortierella sp. AD031]|nr:hypothetical protein BGX23_009604 [Mortierella sp. AD031]
MERSASKRKAKADPCQKLRDGLSILLRAPSYAFEVIKADVPNQKGPVPEESLGVSGLEGSLEALRDRLNQTTGEGFVSRDKADDFASQAATILQGLRPEGEKLGVSKTPEYHEFLETRGEIKPFGL